MSFKHPCLVLGALVIGSSSALAQSQDGLTWRAGITATSNDNFFGTTSGQVSENVTSETLGVKLAVPYSLQRFELDASVVANQYQTYSSFDYTGQNYSGAWLWSVTPRLHGTLSSTRSESLVGPSLNVDPTQRNKSVARNSSLAATYELGGPWQLTAGAVSSSTETERAVIGQSNDSYSGVNAGVRYVLVSGNSLAYFHQAASGSGTTSYTLTTDDVAMVWILSGNTTLNGHLAQLRQRFDVTPQFDFSGTYGGVNMDWRLTGKTSVNVGWQRDIVSYQTANSSYTQTDTFSISPRWQISSITSLSALYRAGVLTDQGNPFGNAPFRQDRLQDTSISFSWQPYSKISLTATLGETSRSSNVVNTDYRARQLSLAALISF